MVKVYQKKAMVKREYHRDYCPRTKRSINTVEGKIRTAKQKKYFPPEYLSENQVKQIAKNLKYYSKFTIDNLKELLAKNRQIKTGSRNELLNRCAEMKELGGLRFCPKCKKGILKFNSGTYDYYCEGNDENCKYKSPTSERNPWIE